jgi:hypothetical protein
MDKDTMLAGRYRVCGGCGDFHLVENVRTGVRWTVRPADSFRSPEVAALLVELRHPALPRVLEEIEHEGRSYLVLEHLEGESLDVVAQRAGGKLREADVVRWMAGIARAVDFLHWQEPEPLLHLDVKPSNIVVGPRGTPCLIDFGAALPLSFGRRGVELFGTRGYAAPEVATGRGARIESDVYGIGATLGCLVTGQEPDPARPLSARDLLAFASAPFARIAARCCAVAPEDRYGSANEVAADLEALLPLMGSADGEEDIEGRGEVEGTAASRRKAARNRGAERATEPEPKGRPQGMPRAPASATGSLPPSPICIWDAPEFGCELASVLATGGRSVLVVDADLLNPRADLLLGLREERREEGVSSRLFPGGGLDEAMEEHARGRLSPDAVAAIARPTAVRGVSALAGDYRMEDYEYYSPEGLAQTLRSAGSAFDAVVVLCGRSLYDAFTCLSLMLSEVVVVPVRAGIAEFREFNRYIAFLGSRRQLDRSRVRFVAFEYHPGADLGWGTLEELSGGAFCGCITDQARRRAYACAGRFHAAAMDEKTLREYRALLPRLAAPVRSTKGAW